MLVSELGEFSPIVLWNVACLVLVEFADNHYELESLHECASTSDTSCSVLKLWIDSFTDRGISSYSLRVIQGCLKASFTLYLSVYSTFDKLLTKLSARGNDSFGKQQVFSFSLNYSLRMPST